jgi:hypothetical protein
MGFPVDMQHVAERFGIPMAGAEGKNT